MRRSAILVSSVILAIGPVASQTPPDTNPEVSKIVSEVSAARLRQTVETLVRFGTRHTLSDTVSTTRGIGAARRWIFAQFEQAAARSGGRMSVAFDEFQIPRSGRVPHATKAANVVATLRSGEPGAAARRSPVMPAHFVTVL